ncbi:LOW QUALITY PROTEIN: uncharacterized protein PEZ65_007881 [Lycodopsis pacificus]
MILDNCDEPPRSGLTGGEMKAAEEEGIQMVRVGLPIVHHSKYVCDLPPNHRFPPVLHHLIKDQVITEKQVWVPEIASKDVLRCVHTEEYLNNFMSGKTNEQEQRRTGFPWSEGIVRRCRYETGGTVLAAEVALQRGLACSTAGGTHHAFPSYGSGFCLLNDLAVAAKYLSVPLAAVIGGGYSRDIDKLAVRHSIGHRAATRVWKECGM